MLQLILHSEIVTMYVTNMRSILVTMRDGCLARRQNAEKQDCDSCEAQASMHALAGALCAADIAMLPC